MEDSTKSKARVRNNCESSPEEQSGCWIQKTKEFASFLQSEIERREMKINQIEQRLSKSPSYSIKYLYKDVKCSLDQTKAQFNDLQRYMKTMATFDAKLEAMIRDLDVQESDLQLTTTESNQRSLANILNSNDGTRENSECTTSKRLKNGSDMNTGTNGIIVNHEILQKALTTLRVPVGVSKSKPEKASREEVPVVTGGNQTNGDTRSPIKLTLIRRKAAIGSGSDGKFGTNSEQQPSFTVFNKPISSEIPQPKRSSKESFVASGDVEAVGKMSNGNHTSVSSMSSVESEYAVGLGLVPTQTCCICKVHHSTLKKKFGKLLCNTCAIFFLKFLRKPTQYYCRNQGACRIDGTKGFTKHCEACWLGACLDMLTLSEKLKSFIVGKFSPKLKFS